MKSSFAAFHPSFRAVILVLAIGAGVWAFYEVRPIVETLASQSMPAYEYTEGCDGTPCNGVAANDLFFVSNQTKEVRLSVDVGPLWRHEEHATGNVHVILYDPAQKAVFDRNFTVTNQTSGSREIRFESVPGNWTVQVEFFEFRGEVRVEAYAYSLGWRDD